MLTETIDQDIIAAMKAGDETKRNVLRMLKSSLKNTQIESQAETLSEEQVQAVVAREIKRRKESVESYKTANRPELAEQELAEIKVLEEYMPAQMDEAEVEKVVDAYLANHQITQSEIGQAMRDLSAELKGKTDLGAVSQILRRKLS